MTFIPSTHTINATNAYSSSAYFDGSNDFFEFTPLSTSDRQKGTVSTWVRLNETDNHPILQSYNAGYWTGIQFSNNGDFYIYTWDGGATDYGTTFNTKLRDYSAWYHIVIAWDTTKNTTDERFRLWVNGEEITDKTHTWGGIPQNHNLHFGNALPHYIGRRLSDNHYSDFKLNHYVYLNGQFLTATDFGEYDSNGVWVHKAFEGTYGSHDIAFDFGNAFRLGDDVAHTVDGFSRINENVKVLSQPSITHNGSVTTVTAVTSIGSWHNNKSASNLAFDAEDTDGFYFRVKCVGATWSGALYFGVVSANGGWENDFNGNITAYQKVTTVSLVSNGYYGVFVKNGSVWINDNGSWIGDPVAGTGATWTGLTGKWLFSVAPNSGGGSQGSGEVDFTDDTWIPTGGKLLNAANLPTPSTYNTNEHFVCDTYTGNGTSLDIKFPHGSDWGNDDYLFITKCRTAAYEPYWWDSLQGEGYGLSSASTAAQAGPSGNPSNYTGTGFTTGLGWGANKVNEDYVYWAFRAGTSGSNTDGTITSTVSHNSTLGFSIVKFTGTGSLATVGHGGSKKPCMIIVKALDVAGQPWHIYNESLGATKALFFDTSVAGTSSAWWNDTEPTSSVFTVNTSGGVNGSGTNYIAYIFFESNLVKPFEYTGNTNTDGPFIYTDGEPLFNLHKCYTNTEHWQIRDMVRDDKTTMLRLFPNLSNAEDSFHQVDFEDTGWKIRNADGAFNHSGQSYLGLSIVGQQPQVTLTGNDFDNIGAAEQSLDSPVDTVCTMSPLTTGGSIALSNANLTVTDTANEEANVRGTLGVSTGKYYFEYKPLTVGSRHNIGVASVDNTNILEDGWTDPSGFWTYGGGSIDTGQKKNNGTATAYGNTFSTTKTYQCAIDMDAGKIWWGEDNVWFASGNPSTGANAAFTNLSGETVTPFWGNGSSASPTGDFVFAEADWTYTAPTGFKQLSTANLDTPQNIDVSQHFATVAYTGDGTSARVITGLNFQPDLVWIKERSGATNHVLYDAVRGAGNSLSSDTANPESVGQNGLTAFNANGFTVDVTGNKTNYNGSTYVAWCFKAGGAGTTDNSGTISATVSANTTLGFSVVKYTGNGSDNASIAHGLGIKPSLIIVKRLDAGSSSWCVWHKDFANTENVFLESTGAKGSYINFGSNGPTSTIVSLGTNQATNANGGQYIAYCFTDSDFIDIGSYDGNGAADGAFVYTDGTPVFDLVKSSSHTMDWYIWDDERDTINPRDKTIYPNDSRVEGSANVVDFTSTGVKKRHGTTGYNGSGYTYIHLTLKKPFGGTVQARAV